MLDIDKLNKFAKNVLSGNLLNTYKPFVGNLDEAVQILYPDEDAFTLKLTTGSIKDVHGNEPTPGNKAIIRVPLSYTLACRMQLNENLFNYHMLNLVNTALNSLTRVYGNLDGKSVFCESPGKPGEFFRDMENAAAVELRFFVS